MNITDKTIETIPTALVASEQPGKENRSEGNPISEKKLAANRNNAKQSTGPRTEEGKRRSRRNAVKHGILSSVLVIKEGDGTEDAEEFDHLFAELQGDLAPVGALENMMVESIAIAYWRARRALQAENGLVRRRFASWKRDKAGGPFQPSADQAAIDDDRRLPMGDYMDQILRYETANHRHLAFLLRQLDSLQRARKESPVPTPPANEVPDD